MDSGGFPEGTRSLEEGGTPRTHFQQATPRGGLGLPPMLWHYMRGKECPVEETQQQGAFWPFTPILKKAFNPDNVKHFDGPLNGWDPFIPTEVIDTPWLNMNKNSYSLNDSTVSISAANLGPPKTSKEPFDILLCFFQESYSFSPKLYILEKDHNSGNCLKYWKLFETRLFV